MDLKYNNITISGGVAVGTTTLMNNLKAYLEPHGWQFKSNGQFVREFTKENVLPLATLVTADMDRKIEGKVKHILEDDKHWVLEGWLSGFVARDMPGVLRILLTCSNEALRVDRVVNRDKVSVHDAKNFIHKREQENFKKWKQVYGDYDFFNPQYYHLVIDTYSSGQHETVGKVLDKLGYTQDHGSRIPDLSQ